MASGNNFLRTAGRILNAGQSRALILTGNIHAVSYTHLRAHET